MKEEFQGGLAANAGVASYELVTSVTPGTGKSLGSIPGRCQNCEYHIETQGHSPTCQQKGTAA